MATHDDVQTRPAALQEKRASWVQKQQQLANAREAMQRNAGAAALEGTPTAKIADQLSRITSEIEIAGQALAVVDGQIAAAELDARVARIGDLRAQIAMKLEEAAALEAAIKPHLDAIEQITGLRYVHPHSKSDRLQEEAQRFISQATYLEGLLSPEAYAQLQAQRDTTPTDIDQAIHRFQYPHAQREMAA
jgi:hypothetical protein